jgi:hypothetical protein
MAAGDHTVGVVAQELKTAELRQQTLPFQALCLPLHQSPCMAGACGGHVVVGPVIISE